VLPTNEQTTESIERRRERTMTSFTNAAHILTRTIAIAALLALLALTVAQRAEANQSGDPVGKTSQQMALCELGGGTVVGVEVVRTPGSGVSTVWFTCKGGLFDGVSCWNHKDPLTDWCTAKMEVLPPTMQTVRPTAGIEAVTDETLPVVESSDVVVVPAEIAEEPATDDIGAETVPAEPTEVADGGEADGGQDLPDLTESDDVEVYPAVDDAVADPNAGATEGEDGTVFASHTESVGNGTILVAEDDELS
jgi:hypothetical protein